MVYDMYPYQPADDQTDTDRMKTDRSKMDRMDMDRMKMDRMGTDMMGMDRMGTDRMDMKPGRSMKYMNEELVRTIQDCEATCEHMSHHIKKMPDFQSRFRQAVLLRDCADICCLTAKALARHSLIGVDAAELCARTCEACGRECAKFPDQMSQNCSKVCLHCARECARFVGM